VRIIFGFAILLISAGPAAAAERIIGLVSLPEVFGGGPCATFEPEDIAIHAAPADGKPIAFIRVDKNWSFAPHGGCEGLKVSVHRGAGKDELPTREFDYEMPGAIAVDRHDGWIKIRLHDGAGWLRPSVVDRFMPLSDLYEEFTGVTSINKSFSSRLVSAPGMVGGPILPQVMPSQPVRVAEIRDEWVKVELLNNSVCTAADNGPPEVIATGWLPLHDANGEPSIWFSSRGC
jgi:hypothetical protein